MRVLILAAALLPTAALADVVPRSPHHHCVVDDRVLAAAQAGQDGFRRLDQLPPAAEYLTIYRSIDRCPAPVVVRYNIGAGAIAPAAAPRR